MKRDVWPAKYTTVEAMSSTRGRHGMQSVGVGDLDWIALSLRTAAT